MLFKFLALVAVVWAVLMPPLFTDGACTREFESLNRAIEEGRGALANPAAGMAWLAGHDAKPVNLSSDDCRRRKPRFLSSCAPGNLVYGEVPVKNLVCKVYRDGAIKVQLQYDERGRLARYVVDMAPFKSLPLPWGGAIHWGR